ncbi:hypothetical protein T4B_6884 [Trichinella pseudospiralis]|uniref:Uncharacterized protein n=1 Tax=Trichinella pseudospiralis TaxID=6337 RepID=A0A0V1IKN2_TRIPS|nr:hypothetical protein T4B_6884 [Trichinella pseudospiralis]
MIKHHCGDRYLHNGALEISFRGLELSEDLFLIGHFIFVPSSSKLSPVSTCGTERKAVDRSILSYLSFCIFFCFISFFYSQLIDVPMYRLAEVELENARMFQYLYPYINSRLLTAAYPPQRHRW